jgi:hypothetical protein
MPRRLGHICYNAAADKSELGRKGCIGWRDTVGCSEVERRQP